MSIQKILLIVFMLIAGMTNAQAVTYYLTETDLGGTVYIVDTETGTYVTRDVSPQENPGAIAITGNRIVMANYDDDGSWEYDLDLNPTGNSWPGSNTWSQMLDGTTDGVHNYAVSWSSNGVIECDLNFENCSLLFNPGFSVIGITYDPTNDSFWVVNDDALTVHNFTRAGSEITSWVADFDERNCCLAYDSQSDTLWMSTNGGSTIWNLNKTGVVLDSVTLSGLQAQNTWGAEISLLGGTGLSSVSVPAMGGHGLALLMLALALAAFVVLRRHY